MKTQEKIQEKIQDLARTWVSMYGVPYTPEIDDDGVQVSRWYWELRAVGLETEHCSDVETLLIEATTKLCEEVTSVIHRTITVVMLLGRNTAGIERDFPQELKKSPLIVVTLDNEELPYNGNGAVIKASSFTADKAVGKYVVVGNGGTTKQLIAVMRALHDYSFQVVDVQPNQPPVILWDHVGDMSDKIMQYLVS